ncbi:MAG: hypothetical protein AB1489_12925 [Acidobacteriota bacterium]
MSSLMHYEIQWIPDAPSGRKWWVFEYRSSRLSPDSERPTFRIRGQYESLEAAQAAYPHARLSEKSKQAWEKDLTGT